MTDIFVMLKLTPSINEICFLFYSYAQSVGAIYFETSAKNNIGVEDVFLNLTNMVGVTFQIMKISIYII